MFGYGATNYWCKTLYKQWFYGLPTRKQAEIPSYVLSLMHHAIAVPFSVYHIYMDYTVYRDVDYGELYVAIIPFTLGYFIADLIMYTIPEALQGRYVYFFHHVFAVVLLVGVFEANAVVVRFLPHMLIMETSTIFFTTAWFLRLWGYRGSIMVKLSEMMFVLMFFLIRIVHVPSFLFTIREHLVSMGLARFFFAPVLLLQAYWFVQIVLTLSSRGVGGKPNKGDDKKDKGDDKKDKDE